MSALFYRTTWLWLVAALCLIGMPAAALDRQRSFDQWHHTRWTASDGAPTGIRKISQTADGWLWLGSTSGLYRFDGVRFERFTPDEDPDFGARPVSTLAAGPQGGLWVGLLDGGIARIDPAGRLTVYPLPADLPSFQTSRLALTAGGQAWAMVSDRLLVFEGGTWRHPDAYFHAPATAPTALHTDANGALWVASDDRWFQLDPERQQFVEKVRGLSAGRAIRIVSGSSWVVTADGLFPLPGSEQRGGSPARQADSSAIWVDAQANLWSAYCPAGLCRTRLPVGWSDARTPLPLPPVTDAWTRRDGLTSDIGMTVLEDRDGHLWVATQTGLDRFRDTALARLTPSSAATNFLLQPYRQVEGDGQWRQHLLLSAVDATHGSLLWRWNEQQGFSPIHWPRDGGRIRALHRDGEGREWVGSTTGLWQLDKGQPRPIAPPASALEAPYCPQLQSSRQGLWVLFSSIGLQLWRDGAWRASPFPGLENERPTAFALEGDSAVWTGYATNRVMRTDAQGSRRYDAGDGLTVGAVNYVHSGRHVLVGGDRGLQVLIQGRFHSLRSTQPEALRGVTGAVETAEGDLWLNGQKGAVRVPAAALTRLAVDPDTTLDLQVLDVNDGYPAAAMALGPQSSAAASGRQRLWFAGLEGIATLDLDHLPPQATGPQVLWLGVAADQHWTHAQDHVPLPAGTQTVSVRFTALELGVPEQVRFEARLQGVDADWRPLGTQRELSYSHLSPGRHQLEVRAMRGDGPASTPATLTFTLRPTLMQTVWMRAVLLLGLLMLMALVLRWRLGVQARRSHEQLRIRMDERAQIAQQLNDTLLQGLHGLTLHFQKVANRMGPKDPNRPLMETALNRADELILRGREQVTELRDDLRRQHLDVAVAWSHQGERRAAAQYRQFLMEVEGTPRALRVGAEEALQAIGQQALNEVFDASTGPSAVRACLQWRWWGLRWTVSADGVTPDWSPPANTRPDWQALLAPLAAHVRMRQRGGWQLTVCVPALRLYEHPYWPWALPGQGGGVSAD